MKKQILSILLTAVLLLSLLSPLSLVSAASGGVCGTGVTWSLDGATLTIEGSGAMDDYVYGGMSGVDTAPWEMLADTICTVVVGDGVTHIGDYAFYGCSQLSSLKLGADVRSIGDGAFLGDRLLSDVTLNNKLETIGASAFRVCPIPSVAFPSSIRRIGDYAFCGAALTEASAPNGSLTYIGLDAFKGTPWQKNATNGELMLGDFVCFYNGSYNGAYTASSGVRGIAGGAFYGQTGLTSLVLPEGAVSIGNAAFGKCSSLASISLPATLSEIGYGAFSGCTALKEAVIPSRVKSLEGTFSGCTALENVSLPDTLVTLGDFTFYNCTSLTHLYLPEKIESLGNYVLAECPSLIDFIAPDGLKSIGEFALYHDASLVAAVLSPDLAELPYSCFSGCKALKGVRVPDGVTTIGDYAFSACDALLNVVIPDSVSSIADHTFAASSPRLVCDAESYAASYGNSHGVPTIDHKDSEGEITTPVYFVKEDAEGGDGSRSHPFTSLADAITAMDGADGIAYIIGTYNITSFPSSFPWEGMVTVCGLNDDSCIYLQKNCELALSGDMTFRNINFDIGQYAHFNSHSHKLVMDAGTGHTFTGMIHMNSTWGTKGESGEMVVNSGSLGTIYFGGGYSDKTTAGVSGDSTLTINGGDTASVVFYADHYASSQTYITIGGNANIIVNGGTVGQFSAGSDFDCHILGALNLIFNNGTSIPEKFAYPEAAEGVYVIRSSSGGCVMPTSVPGTFTLSSDEGKAAKINGKTYTGDSVSLDPGTYTVDWVGADQTSDLVYYVKAGASASGADGSLSKPFPKLESAIAAFGGKGGTAVIIGTYSLTGFGASAWKGTVVVTGYDGNACLTTEQSAGSDFRGNIVFENIAFSAGQWSHINPIGNRCVFNIGDGNVFNSFLHLSAYGNNKVDSAEFVLESGKVGGLHFGGGYSTSYNNGVTGDTTLIINGGTFGGISLSADRYAEGQVGISVGGNANIIINGGTMTGGISYNNLTAMQIMGSLNIVFNNGIAAPVITHPEAACGTYIIESDVGGSVMPTEEVGVFELKAKEGNKAVINGKAYEDGLVTLPAGNTKVTWSSSSMAESAEVSGIVFNKTSLTLKPGETDSLSWTLYPQITTDDTVYLMSTNPEVAEVSDNGEICAFTKGRTVIMATAKDGGYTEVCTLFVKEDEPDVLYGDANGDGIVNNRDASRILQFLSKWPVEIDEKAADVNGDGVVTNRDASRILQFLAKWPVTLGPAD